MLDASRRRILGQLGPDDLVLDVGGGAAPFERADWVLDLMPYEARGAYGERGGAERFSAETWVQRDICDREPWPFADGMFDFAVCSHTLEDVRDPIWVCSELERVARAGYIEVPSRLEEQSYGFEGPWTGWTHHRWLVDLTEDGLEFAFKSPVVHLRARDRFPTGYHDTLTDEQRVQWLWWEGEPRARERIFTDAPSYDGYLLATVAAHRPRRIPARPWLVGHARLLRHRWVHRRRLDLHRRWLARR